MTQYGKSCVARCPLRADFVRSSYRHPKTISTRDKNIILAFFSFFFSCIPGENEVYFSLLNCINTLTIQKISAPVFVVTFYWSFVFSVLFFQYAKTPWQREFSYLFLVCCFFKTLASLFFSSSSSVRTYLLNPLHLLFQCRHLPTSHFLFFLSSEVSWGTMLILCIFVRRHTPLCFLFAYGSSFLLFSCPSV